MADNNQQNSPRHVQEMHVLFWRKDYFSHFLKAVDFLLQINGAGGRHSASILSYDRQVSRAVVVWDKVVWLVVAVWVGGVVCNFTSYAVRKVVWGHVLDELRRAKQVSHRAVPDSLSWKPWMVNNSRALAGLCNDTEDTTWFILESGLNKRTCSKTFHTQTAPIELHSG